MSFRLIGYHILGEKLCTFHGISLKLLKKQFKTVTFLCRDGDYCIKLKSFCVGSNNGQYALFRQCINLVDSKNAGQAAGLYFLNKSLLRRGSFGLGLNDHKNAVSVLKTFSYDLDHIVAQFVSGFVETRSINQNDLGLIIINNTDYTVTGGLGFR